VECAAKKLRVNKITQGRLDTYFNTLAESVTPQGNWKSLH